MSSATTEDKAEFGVDVYNPSRRLSKTALDFDNALRYFTFQGRFKGGPVRVWVSEEGIALRGLHIKKRYSWYAINKLHAPDQVGPDANVLIIVPHYDHKIRIKNPTEAGVERMLKTFKRFKVKEERKGAPDLANTQILSFLSFPQEAIAWESQQDLEPPASMSVFRQHPYLLILLHGVLVGRRVKSLVFSWLVLSLYLAAQFLIEGNVFPRIFFTMAVLANIGWWTAHIEFFLDWEQLIEPDDLDFVEQDFINMLLGRNLTRKTQIISILGGIVLMYLSFELSPFTMSFLLVGLLLMVVMSMLNHSPGEIEGPQARRSKSVELLRAATKFKLA